MSLTGGSKLRTRKLDIKKPVKIYSAADVPEVDHAPARLRAPPQIVSGVEKEEEEEEHLQAVISSRQIGNSRSAKDTYIPTPDASKTITPSEYEKLYPSNFKLDNGLIRYTSTEEEYAGVIYCLDDRDDEWLQALNHTNQQCGNPTLSEDMFERLLDSAERMGNQRMWSNIAQNPTYEEFLTFIKEENTKLEVDRQIAETVFDYWRQRRYDDLKGKPVLPLLKIDFVGPGSETDPYVCFRKREIRAVRKTRRCDLQSLDKLKRLRDEMKRAQEILEKVAEREQLRKDSLLLEQQIFEQRIFVKRLKKKLGIVNEREKSNSPTRRKGKDRLKMGMRGDGMDYAREVLSAEERARQLKISEEAKGWLDVTEDPYVPVEIPAITSCWNYNYPFQEENDAGDHEVVRGRKRVGRGGRVLIDRHIRVRSHIPPVPFPPSNGMHLRLNSAPSPMFTNKGKSPQPAVNMDQWMFDNSDDDEIVEIEDKPRFFAYRSFFLQPTYGTMANKPVFPDQIETLRSPIFGRMSSTGPNGSIANPLITSASTSSASHSSAQLVSTTFLSKLKKNKSGSLSQSEITALEGSSNASQINNANDTIKMPQESPTVKRNPTLSISPTTPNVPSVEMETSPPSSPAKPPKTVAVPKHSKLLKMHSPTSPTPSTLPQQAQTTQQQQLFAALSGQSSPLLQRRGLSQQVPVANGINGMNAQMFLQQQQQRLMPQQQRLQALQQLSVATNGLSGLQSGSGSSSPIPTDPSLSTLQQQQQQLFAKIYAVAKASNPDLQLDITGTIGTPAPGVQSPLMVDGVNSLVPQGPTGHSLA
ncbi:Enhancer of polycomb-like protein 1 [Nowakowskiella sp. JEL0407]|nr:Enhancer of polycomb-like protein 1 [Nowakowskiella sp. JEL0407]